MPFGLFNALRLFYFGFPKSLDFGIETLDCPGALLCFHFSCTPDEVQLSYRLVLFLDLFSSLCFGQREPFLGGLVTCVCFSYSDRFLFRFLMGIFFKLKCFLLSLAEIGFGPLNSFELSRRRFTES